MRVPLRSRGRVVVAGEGEEDVVERGLAAVEVDGVDAGVVERAHRRPSGGCPRRTGTVAMRRSSSNVGRVRRERASVARRPRRARRATATVTSTRSVPMRAFSSSGVPCATVRPWSSTTMSSASWSASSRYWVVSTIVVPSRARSRSMSQSSLRLRGSSPVVGSSRNSTSGAATRLAARSSRRRMPPENVFTRRSAASARSKRSSSSSARRSASRFGRWCSRPTITRFFRALSSPSTVACCAATPMRCAHRVRVVDDVEAGDAWPIPRSGPTAWSGCGSPWSCRRRCGRAGRGRCPARRRGRGPAGPRGRRSACRGPVAVSRHRRAVGPVRRALPAPSPYVRMAYVLRT